MQLPAKRTGLACPLDPLQVIAWVIVGLLFCLFGVLLAFLKPEAALTSGLMFGLFASLVLVSGYLCTNSDPTDPAVDAERLAREKNYNYDVTAFTKVCRICSTHVHETSKHCSVCNRCVIYFDHHCRWLNNCIGKRNFIVFGLLLASLEFCALVELVVCSYVISQLLDTDSYEYKMTCEHWGNIEGLLAIASISSLLSSVVIVAIGHLIAYHTWLRAKGLTTYEYILQRRARSQNKEEKAAAYRDKIDIKVDHDNSSGALILPTRRNLKIMPSLNKEESSQLLNAQSEQRKD